ncbi:MAG: hypothetical protein Kow0099_22820 [Candidatus Abyssubacteria bacterium]
MVTRNFFFKAVLLSVAILSFSTLALSAELGGDSAQSLLGTEHTLSEADRLQLEEQAFLRLIAPEDDARNSLEIPATSFGYAFSSGSSSVGPLSFTYVRSAITYNEPVGPDFDAVPEIYYIRSTHPQVVNWTHIANTSDCWLYEVIMTPPDSSPDWSFNRYICATYDWYKMWISLPIAGEYCDVYPEGIWTSHFYLDGVKYESLNWTYRFELDDQPYRPDDSSHTMCSGVSPDPYDPINPGKTIFTATDSAAYSWVRLDGVSESVEVMREWYDPFGNLYHSSSFPLPDPGTDQWFGWYKQWGWIYIDGYPAASKLGQWEVKFFTKNCDGQWQYRFSDTFEIVPPGLTQINLQSPANNSIVSSPPTFTWTVSGGTNNVYAVDASLTSGFTKYWSTYEDMRQIIRATSWTMPLPVWKRVPAGTLIYWRVRGTDLDSMLPVIIHSNETWSFRKQ